MAAGYASSSGPRTGSHWRLPGWARAGLAGAGKTKVGGTLHKDAPLSSIRVSPLGRRTGQLIRDGEKRGEVGRRVAQLENSIAFLRQQHMETLQQLHSETDRLKKENRELSFRMIMCHCGDRSASSGNKAGHQPPSYAEPNTPTNELHVLFLQEEAEQLRQALAEEKRRNQQMLQLLQCQQQDLRSSECEGGRMTGGGRECEAVIRLLQKEKEQKVHELSRDLRDILFSHKWTPDAYLQTRGYIPHTSSRGEQGQGRERALQRVQDNMQLPALKPHLLGGVAERQRRRQAVQRTSTTRLPALHPPE